MLVSILVPVYKGAEYLDNLIRNVQAQTYPNFELILIDDASPDNSTKIVGQFNDPRIKYFRHEINKGADQARKTGLEISRGEIISFLDQDDLFHPDKLNEHINLFLRDPSLGVAYNSRFVINESPESINGMWCAPSKITLADLVLGYPIDTGGVPYPVFSYIALMPWTLLAASVPDMAQALVLNMNLVTKIYFPREVLPISALLARLMDFGVVAGLLVVLMVVYKLRFFPPSLLYLPVILAIQLLLLLGLGLASAAANVFFPGYSIIAYARNTVVVLCLPDHISDHHGARVFQEILFYQPDGGNS